MKGGKTAHLASLSQNRAKVIAFDKIESKVLAMKSLFEKMELTSIQCFHQDSTKIGLFA
jgi:16S rRNA C967 or C1407 C5-methylase (RsmB/RsmF family)